MSFVLFTVSLLSSVMFIDPVNCGPMPSSTVKFLSVAKLTLLIVSLTMLFILKKGLFTNKIDGIYVYDQCSPS